MLLCSSVIDALFADAKKTFGFDRVRKIILQQRNCRLIYKYQENLLTFIKITLCCCGFTFYSDCK